MFDTHCHLNFQVFNSILDRVIKDANNVGVNRILVPGTDVESSIKAIEIANKYKGVYAAVGIHPHHLFACNMKHVIYNIEELLKTIKKLIIHPKVVAIGEVGIDRHIYKKTKYDNYEITQELIKMQEQMLIEQIKMSMEYDKSLILHNWEATNDLLSTLNQVWDKKLENRIVFHCCEADRRLLDYAINHKIYIGVDGDVIYKKDKQEFIKIVPLNLLVLETDSPYLSPLRKYPNEPKNLPIISEFISKLTSTSFNQLNDTTTENAKKLFSPKY